LLLGSDDSRPVTLLLDQQGVVRQAFVGSFGKSTNELIQAIEHLLAAVSGRPITRSP
jgi:UDP-3-O-acyl-N-acetylglucosamine deacetylase